MPNYYTPKRLPLDWEAPINYNGVTRNAKAGVYHVTLTVNGKQCYVGCSDVSAEHAARIYDAALRELLPFTTSRAMPNFPDDFWAIKDSATPILAKAAYLKQLDLWCAIYCRPASEVISMREERTKQINSRRGNPLATPAIAYSADVVLRKLDTLKIKLGCLQLKNNPLLNQQRAEIYDTIKKLSALLAQLFGPPGVPETPESKFLPPETP